MSESSTQPYTATFFIDHVGIFSQEFDSSESAWCAWDEVAHTHDEALAMVLYYKGKNVADVSRSQRTMHHPFEVIFAS